MRIPSRVPALAGALLALALLGGCSSDSASGPEQSTTALVGSLVTSDGRTGSLLLESSSAAAMVVASGPEFSLQAGMASAGVITLTGTVTLADGTTATLSGTWNTDTGALSVSGGGFAFSGTIVDGSLSGSFTGPSITGFFSLQVGTVADGLAVYCGTFTGREPDDMPSGGTGTAPDNGTWNLVVGPSSVQVLVVSDEGEAVPLTGSRSGSTVTITVPGGSATGTLAGANSEFVAGTYTIAGVSQGTFQGSEAACTATTESAPIVSITINHPGIVSGAIGERFVFDSTLVFATAKDANGNYVAAPQLDWSYTGAVRSNNATTAPGQKWFVPTGAGSSSVTVKSHSNPAVTASRTILIQ